MRTQFNANRDGRYETAVCRGTYLNRLSTAIIYLDGIRMNGNGASFDFSSLLVQHIQAVEVYKSSVEVPADIGAPFGADCVVAIWTK